MRNPISGTQFRRDVRLAQKRGKDMAKLREAILLLIAGSPLPRRYKDHTLTGDTKHFDKCHVEPGSAPDQIPRSLNSASAEVRRFPLPLSLIHI